VCDACQKKMRKGGKTGKYRWGRKGGKKLFGL